MAVGATSIFHAPSAESEAQRGGVVHFTVASFLTLGIYGTPSKFPPLVKPPVLDIIYVYASVKPPGCNLMVTR